MSLELHGDTDAAGQVCERTRVSTLAVSLGSVESLIEHPARMTHCTTAGTPVGVSAPCCACRSASKTVTS